MTKRVRLWWHEHRGHFIVRNSRMKRLACVNCDLKNDAGVM